MSRNTPRRAYATLLFLLAVPRLHAQVTPAEGYTPPDDTPTFKVGGVIFSDYTYVKEPTSTDADGNKIHSKGFDVRRAYINVTGNISSLWSYRVTPDITRQTLKTEGTQEGEKITLSNDGSLVYRLKYAYGQLNFDRWQPKGSFLRFGLQQTPYVDYMESIYRYRFQGTMFSERVGLLSSSDFALSYHLNFPHNLGDFHVGYYNGDTYTKAESNDQQALMIRAAFRPAPKAGALGGLRICAFYDDDRYAKSDPRKRLFANVTFEHKFINAGLEYADAKDQTTATATEVKSKGYSAFVTPKTTFGLEGLLRYDNFKPDDRVDGYSKRTIVGIAYWFKVQKGVAATVMLDYDGITYDAILKKTNDKRYALHTLFTF
ncbi:MAG: porin [Acidobacteriota bacterium]